MDYEQIESSQRQDFEVRQHQEKMNLIVEQEEYNLFVLIKPKLYKDGNQWCCLYGSDTIEGIAGFGDTPYKAIQNWDSEWQKSLLQSPTGGGE
ncbi:hypothetical protein LCGC14_2917320 [marine sediment metagenome]|uniref:Uncharacterized protein n=1 Tax=marine sediment metagenome TaxID=412755 RepID=A0A0F9AFT7_9ZZZZ